MVRLTPEVEQIHTDGTPAREPASVPARQHADVQTGQRANTPQEPPRRPQEPAEADRWVNFSTYLPAPLRRELRARCALLDVELRQATADAITAWLADNPAEP